MVFFSYVVGKNVAEELVYPQSIWDWGGSGVVVGASEVGRGVTGGLGRGLGSLAGAGAGP